MGQGIMKMSCFCVYTLFLVQIPSQAFLFDDKTTAVPQGGNAISDKNYFALVDMILKEKQLREQYMVQIKDRILATESKTSVLEHKVDSITPNNGTVSMEDYIRLENSFTSLQREFASLTKKYDELKSDFTSLRSNSTSIATENRNTLNATQLKLDKIENEVQQLQTLKAIEGRQDIQNVKNNITLIDNGVKVLGQKINNLDMKQQARAQDFLALYNTTINLQSAMTTLTSGVHSMQSNIRTLESEMSVFKTNSSQMQRNFSMELVDLQTDQKHQDTKITILETDIHEMNATLLKTHMAKESKQVAVTACANAGTVKASTPMLFQSIITSYGVKQTQSLVTSGIFKCEDSGLYIVSFTVFSSTYNAFFHIFKNSKYLVDAYTANQPDGYYYTGTASVAVQLDINDQITVKPERDSTVDGASNRQDTCITLIKVN